MNFYESIIRNWKTTAAGIALLAITFVFLRGEMPAHEYLAAVGILAAGGLMLASDSHQPGK